MNLTPTFSAGIGWPEKQSHCATATSANQQVICRVLHILMYSFSMHNSRNKGTFCVIEQCMLKKYVAIMARPFFLLSRHLKKKKVEVYSRMYRNILDSSQAHIICQILLKPLFTVAYVEPCESYTHFGK